jgi:hypothetical protein
MTQTARITMPRLTAIATQNWLAFAEIGLVFLVFAVDAGWPVPDVNETCYLGKAKHYWNPSWCAADFFFRSADAHLVFYWTFGWVTRWLSLPAAAWLGRIITWGLLAWAWRRLSVTVAPGPLLAGLSAALLVVLLDRFHLAGEWVVGGVEAKGFAYVLVFLGLDALLRGRWNRVWILLGAASAFHVLVGGWSVLLAGWVWIVSPSERPPLRAMVPGLAVGLVLALPGLIPGLLLTRGVDSAVVDQANQIYVFRRLPHHLALHTLKPEEFTHRLIRYGSQLVAFGVLCALLPAGRVDRRLRWFVVGSLLIAICGMAISLSTRDDPALAAKLLRYYWMRLSDVALPIGVALTATAFIAKSLARNRRMGVWCLACGLLAAGLHLGTVVHARHEMGCPRADRKLRDYDDWRDMCQWIAENVEPDAVFLTPRGSQTFKWYAGRAEVVNYKDLPQDAPGIVEWWRRVDAIYRHDERGERVYCSSLAKQTAALLTEVGQRYAADYMVTRVRPPLVFDWLYRNGTYAIYRLPSNGRHAKP